MLHTKAAATSRRRGGKAETLTITKKTIKKKRMSSSTISGLGTGGSSLVLDFMPAAEAGVAFGTIMEEVQWCEMQTNGKAVPRLVSIQGNIISDGGAGGYIPHYRHPADVQPAVVRWTPFVQRVVERATAQFKTPFNHALVQLYRSGSDSISQ